MLLALAAAAALRVSLFFTVCMEKFSLSVASRRICSSTGSLVMFSSGTRSRYSLRFVKVDS